MLYERFDPTLEKYKLRSSLSTVTPVTPISTPKVALADLWQSFVEYKRPQCSPNTMKFKYSVFTNYVKRLPTHNLERATEIRDYVLTNIPLDSGKQFITRLSACCKWAIRSGLIAENPFEGMAVEIKLPKSRNSEDDITPFSAEERDAIIAAIETDRFCPRKSGFKHSRYAPLIKFLFFTGCRPSEAIALQWKHISSDFRYITFEQAVIEGEDGAMLRHRLKTQERRKFPCNAQLQAILSSLKPSDCNLSALVFPSPELDFIHQAA